ncbi:hypothetical protein HDU76_003206, partial [Blyttiomyces sp. JEL0837]
MNTTDSRIDLSETQTPNNVDGAKCASSLTSSIKTSSPSLMSDIHTLTAAPQHVTIVTIEAATSQTINKHNEFPPSNSSIESVDNNIDTDNSVNVPAKPSKYMRPIPSTDTNSSIMNVDKKPISIPTFTTARAESSTTSSSTTSNKDAISHKNKLLELRRNEARGTVKKESLNGDIGKLEEVKEVEKTNGGIIGLSLRGVKEVDKVGNVDDEVKSYEFRRDKVIKKEDLMEDVVLTTSTISENGDKSRSLNRDASSSNIDTNSRSNRSDFSATFKRKQSNNTVSTGHHLLAKIKNASVSSTSCAKSKSGDAVPIFRSGLFVGRLNDVRGGNNNSLLNFGSGGLPRLTAGESESEKEEDEEEGEEGKVIGKVVVKKDCEKGDGKVQEDHRMEQRSNAKIEDRVQTSNVIQKSSNADIANVNSTTKDKDDSFATTTTTEDAKSPLQIDSHDIALIAKYKERAESAASTTSDTIQSTVMSTTATTKTTNNTNVSISRKRKYDENESFVINGSTDNTTTINKPGQGQPSVWDRVGGRVSQPWNLETTNDNEISRSNSQVTDIIQKVKHVKQISDKVHGYHDTHVVYFRSSARLIAGLPDGSRMYMGNLEFVDLGKKMKGFRGGQGEGGVVVSGTFSEEIGAIFVVYGDVLEIMLRGSYGFVQFRNPEACAEAVRVENGRRLLNGARLKLAISVDNKRSKFGASSSSYRPSYPSHDRDNSREYDVEATETASNTTWDTLRDRQSSFDGTGEAGNRHDRDMMMMGIIINVDVMMRIGGRVRGRGRDYYSLTVEGRGSEWERGRGVSRSPGMVGSRDRDDEFEDGKGDDDTLKVVGSESRVKDGRLMRGEPVQKPKEVFGVHRIVSDGSRVETGNLQ